MDIRRLPQLGSRSTQNRNCRIGEQYVEMEHIGENQSLDQFLNLFHCPFSPPTPSKPPKIHL
ncbi:hypothetical protein ACJ72_05144 [Emergomyces africanus]|uniref:Uncharacterized protein n=1 Tax=Emergomyces africanus TaxID=1955775 RepID=A0A1B7NUR9_9EURO|nr:hypothetical protein ACJ72_05144 [Emergomyces africanus]